MIQVPKIYFPLTIRSQTVSLVLCMFVLLLQCGREQVESFQVSRSVLATPQKPSAPGISTTTSLTIAGQRHRRLQHSGFQVCFIYSSIHRLAFLPQTILRNIPIRNHYMSSTSLKSSTDSDEEFFNVEPDDSDLAKLGEELGDLEVEVDEEVDDADGGPDVAVIQQLGFDNSFQEIDVEDSILVDDAFIGDDDDDEIDIEFDDDDDVIFAASVPTAVDDELVTEEEDEEVSDESEYFARVDEDYEAFDDEEDEWEDSNIDDEYDYELEDDDDPNYMIQKARIEESMAKLDQEDMEMAARERQWTELVETMEASEEKFEDFEFTSNFDAEAVERGEEGPQLQWSDNIADQVKQLMSSESNLVTVVDSDLEDMTQSFDQDRDPNDPLDPYEAADQEIDVELKQVQFERLTQGKLIDELETLRTAAYDQNTPRSEFMDVNHVAEIGMDNADAFRDIPENIVDEIKECMTEMGSASYNVTKWLVYDLNFNVTNLMLAACKHNPKAPILFEHWFPQLQVCERYKYARDGNFSFTWEDAENADMEELYVYYRGFGYSEIPEKAPGDTGIIDLEELDDDEVQMVDFAAWCQEVYNPEWDRKDFDDDDIKSVDNVYSPDFILPQDPDRPAYQDAKDDIRNWYSEIENSNDNDVSVEQAEYRDMLGHELEYKYWNDEEFTEAFRGHLIVACTAEEEDLDVAEKITIRFEEEFGKQVFVETRVMSHAMVDDNCFEVWLESYDIELLHSKKRATTGAKDWTGPIDCDDDEIEKMIERVAFLISDDARYSYRMDMDAILS